MSFRILLPMKRRAGLSVEEFRAYYERHHAPLAAEHAAGLSRYVRRYWEPHDHPETGPAGELPYDVVTELWFDDEATFRATLRYLETTRMPPDIVADEERLFDRSSFRIVTVVEEETDLAAVRRRQRR